MSNDQPSQTTADVVEAVFAACIVRYGRAYFFARWEGVVMRVIKADWRRVLEGLERNPAAVRYALANLPLKPPTADEFRRIAANAPLPRHPCLSWQPEHNPARVAAAREQVAQARAKPARTLADPLAPARALRAREEAGEKLSRAQKDFWRTALARELKNERLQEQQP